MMYISEEIKKEHPLSLKSYQEDVSAGWWDQEFNQVCVWGVPSIKQDKTFKVLVGMFFGPYAKHNAGLFIDGHIGIKVMSTESGKEIVRDPVINASLVGE